jgi:hypothetical protein
LINNSDARLSVGYPIQIYGSPLGAPARVTTAEVATSESTSSAAPPPRLRTLRPGQHAVLWIGLRVSCHNGWRYPPLWPTGTSVLAIPLDGYPMPATFELRDLLGFSVTSSIRQACPG